MKAFVLFVTLLVTAFPAVAEHHRGHVLEFEAKIAPRLNSLDYQWRKFNESYVCRDGWWVQCANTRNRINSIDIHITRIRIDHEWITANIKTTALDDARRRLTQPRDNSGATPTDKRLFSVEYNLSQLLNTVNLTGNERLRLLAMQRLIAHIWEDTDRVLWHINDAIREEIYQDPAFGPPPSGQ